LTVCIPSYRLKSCGVFSQSRVFAVQSSKMVHAALLLLMLEARKHGDLVSPSA
jgi:hypothetical protein